jgi:hypothetical protein
MATAAQQLEREYWQILGDPAPDERQRLAGLNDQHLSWRLERLLGALGRSDIGPVCTGFQVSSYFHAAATPVDSGMVVLISDQLFDVALGVCIFVAASAPWTFGSEDAPADVSEAEADEAIRRIIESSVLGTAPVQMGMHDLAPPRFTGLQMMLGTL